MASALGRTWDTENPRGVGGLEVFDWFVPTWIADSHA